VIEKQKKKRELTKISVGEGIDLFITYMWAVKNEKKREKDVYGKRKKILKKKMKNGPFPMI
jgi:hypothetical protein